MIYIKITFTPYTLQLISSWQSQHGRFRQREGWLVTASNSSGRRGYGDCLPLPDAGTETLEHARQFVQASPTMGLPDGIAGVQPVLRKIRMDHPAVACGLETAALDLACRQNGQTLSQHLNPETSRKININAALGSLAETRDEPVVQALEAGFQVLKFKVGIAKMGRELDRLQQIAGLLDDAQALRLDANQGWSMAQATEFLNNLHGLPIDSIEEPLRDPDLDSLGHLQERTNIPIALDESIPHLDTGELFKAVPVRRLTIKPMVMGGLLPGIELARKARNAGMTCVVSTTIDSAVGVWAAAHLAAAMDPLFPGLAHGLGTSSWLREDLAEPPTINRGKILLPQSPGLGINHPGQHHGN